MSRERMLDLQQTFNDLIAGKTLKILFMDKASYESARTSLLRKYRKYREAVESIGGEDPFEGQYLKAAFDKDEIAGTFQLAAQEAKKNLPVKVYQVIDL